jgi:serine protease Do
MVWNAGKRWPCFGNKVMRRNSIALFKSRTCDAHAQPTEISMGRGIIASKLAVRRNRRGALLLGGLAVAMTALLANAQLVPDAGRTHLHHAVGIERTPPNLSGFADVVRAVRPAVVAIAARAVEDDPVSFSPRIPHGIPEGSRSRFGISQGSGFFITGDGYVVTNNHVVQGSTTVEVRTDDGETHKAAVIGTDRVSDLALLKVDGRQDFAHVQFADSPPHVGDWIIAVGNPFGLGGTVTAGIVSARGRDVTRDSVTKNSYEDLLQIDAPVNRGNSGGPTFDVDGNVVGINTVILSPTGGSIGIAFAIPSDKAKLVVEQLKEKGSVTRGWLGMQFQSVSPEIADTLGLDKPAGILIADVQPAGPAATAGVGAGDVVDSIDGEAVKDAHEFSRTLDGISPDSTVTLGLHQKGRQISVAVTVGRFPSQTDVQPRVASRDDHNSIGDRMRLGLKLVPQGAISSNGQGVAVAGVDPGGLAAGRGIDLGDTILDVGGQATAMPEDVYRLVGEAQKAGKRSALVRIRSGETVKFVALPIS